MNQIRVEDDDGDDAVWRALAHVTRRRILDVLRAGPCTTGDLVKALGMGRHQVLQHLAVLREVDLVVVEVHGRKRINYLNPVPIRCIYERWVSRYEQNWTAALVGLRDTVQAQQGVEQEGRNVG